MTVRKVKIFSEENQYLYKVLELRNVVKNMNLEVDISHSEFERLQNFVNILIEEELKEEIPSPEVILDIVLEGLAGVGVIIG